MKYETYNLGDGPKRHAVYAMPVVSRDDYWANVTDVPCPVEGCTGTIRWNEAGYVAGSRICDGCGRFFQAGGSIDGPGATLIRDARFDRRVKPAKGEYAIQYYGSDGSGNTHSPIEDGFPTRAAARAEIHRRVGNHGQWAGEGDDDPEAWAWQTVEAWHESADEGCGGYVVMRRKPSALELAIESAEHGKVVAAETGTFISAYAGDGGSLVQMHADGTFDVDGDRADGGLIPVEYRERVAALIGNRRRSK